MSTEKMREEFETIYPLPDGVRWAGVAYAGSEDAELLNIALEAWCLSRTTRSKDMVWCACGDGYPCDSYGAGFMAANDSVCENCDATK